MIPKRYLWGTGKTIQPKINVNLTQQLHDFNRLAQGLRDEDSTLDKWYFFGLNLTGGGTTVREAGKRCMARAPSPRRVFRSGERASHRQGEWRANKRKSPTQEHQAAGCPSAHEPECRPAPLRRTGRRP